MSQWEMGINGDSSKRNILIKESIDVMFLQNELLLMSDLIGLSNQKENQDDDDATVKTRFDL